jgi:hypothetical protein
VDGCALCFEAGDVGVCRARLRVLGWLRRLETCEELEAFAGRDAGEVATTAEGFEEFEQSQSRLPGRDAYTLQTKQSRALYDRPT